MPADPVVALLAARDVTPDVVAAWRDLAARAAEPNPVNEPDVLLPAMTHLPRGDAARLLVVRRGREIDACLPVLPTARWRPKVPVPALVSWTHDYQLLGTPLVDGDRTRDTLAALLRAPWRTRRAALLLALDGTGDDGPVARALDEAAEELGGAALRWETHERAALVRRPDGTVAPLSGSRRKRVGRSRRALERVAGAVAVVDHAGDPAAVERFLALEAAGWKGRAGTAMAVRPADAAFFREVCARFADAGRLELRTLEVPAGPVAMQVALRAGDSVFHMKVAYAEEYGDHSPGVQLLVDYAERFPSEALTLRDSCTAAENVTESQVWPGRRRVSDVVVPFAGLVGRVGVGALARLRSRRSSGRGGSGAAPDGAPGDAAAVDRG